MTLTKVERKIYDSEGTETSAFGLPCTTETDYWNGSINSDSLSCDDAFNIEEINIDDNHSTGLVSLVAKIAEVQSQERCIPTDFTKPIIKGYPIKEDDTVDWDADKVEDELIEVTPETPITINNIPVKHIWKSSGSISYFEPSSSVIMDNRDFMTGYNTDYGEDVIYKILPSSYATDEIKNLLDITTVSDNINVTPIEGIIDNYYEIASKSDYLLGVFSRINLNKFLGLTGIKVGINGSMPGWMVTAHVTYGIAYGNLVKAFSEWSNVQYAFHANSEGKYVYLVGDGNAHLVLSNITYGSTNYENFRYRLIGRISNYGSNWNIQGIGGDSQGNCYVGISASKKFSWGCSGSDNASSIDATPYWDKVLEYDLNYNEKKYIVKQGDTEIVNTNISPVAPTHAEGSMGLFGWKSVSGSYSTWGNQTTKGAFRMAIYGHIDVVEHLIVPFYRNGEYGMLDLMTDTFYTNANTSGSFTYSLE